MSTSKRETDKTNEPSNEARASEQAAFEKSAPADDTHVTVVPSEADYEKARTVGIGDEPELPAGKVENSARAQVATDAESSEAVSRAKSASTRS